jgi:Ca-activated chloride channel family protein|tara:strand:- start:375 stop:1301 length:927 start_codon:yes stop_codon:yes gene_type:complete
VEFIFLYPKFLLLLLLVPFFVVIYFFGIAYNKKKALLFANFEAMERFYNIEFFSKNFLALYINLVILIMFILAVSGTSVSFNVDTSAFSYVVAIDNSDSMATVDVLPNRLGAAKNAAKNFVELLPVGVEVGVIGFSGDSMVLQTMDSSKIKTKIAIDNLDYGPIQGTNIYNALITSNKLFEEKQIKAIILISDGQLNVGDAPQINNYIERNNLIVNTIAVGTPEGGLTEFNTISKTDEDFLKALAFNSGGQFFMAEDFEDIGDSFNTLILETNRDVTIDLSFYFLLIGLALFTILWILYNLRFKILPI